MDLDVGKRIREIRKQKQLSLKAVAARAGWSASYQSQLEKGKQKWNKDNLPKLAAILGVSILDFFRDPADLPFLAEGEAAQALFSLARDERLTDEEKRAMDREIADFIVYLRERRTGGHSGGHP